MASSNLLKKLRNKISKKKSYDIDTPCSAGHGTILLRRYDRVPSTYGDGHIDRQNILRDFAPPAPKQSPGRFRGEMTLPRHFRFKTNHHRTQSNVTVVDHEDIDLYNAIGDHRRSSCSCTCTTPRKIMSPITPPNGTMHLSPHVAIPSMGTLGKGRNAAKDPLPPIVKAKREVEMEKEQERLKHEGKFDVAQEEVPRYTGIDDYSNVDFQSPPGCDSKMPVQVPASTMMAPRSRHVENPEQSHRARDTLPPHVKPQAPRVPTSQTAKNAQLTKETQEIQLPKQKAMANGHPEKTSPRKHVQSVHEGQRQQNHRKDPELIDVIDCYYNNDETSLPTNDLPIPHESCINKDRKVSQPVQCETANRSQDEVDGLSMLSCSAPSGSMMHCQSSLDDLSHPRHYPQNSGHHEYKEAHQLLRATSVGKIDSLQDLEVSSSVEDLYAHVPKGTAKTPDMDDMDSVVSDPNTDNEDSLPPPPIPSRNYRSTDNCCSTAAQLGAGGCSCSHLKDMETGEELLEDGPQSVIHQQPRSTKEADDEVKQVVEPIHMTLEEVWQDACARGIPMEKPSTMTLQRRPKSTAVVNSALTNSPTAGTDGKQSKDNKIKDTDTTEDTATQSTAAALAAAKKKEKFKLKNIFKKTDHDHSPSKSPTPGHRRTLSTPAVVTTTTDDAHNCSDPLNTSGETSSSELSESVGNTSNCSSADSGVDDVSAHPPSGKYIFYSYFH